LINVVASIKGRKDALLSLENAAQNFIIRHGGQSALDMLMQNSNGLLIRDIASLEQIKYAPSDLVDGFYIYRLQNDPDKLFIYQKTPKLSQGIVWNSYISSWCRLIYFHLVYTDLLDNVSTRSEAIEMVCVGAKSNNTAGSGIRIPRAMTLSPIADVLNELKESDRFKKIRSNI
jgi:hypothetical protein